MSDATKKPSLDTLEALLKEDEDVPFEILPNGEIRETEGRREAPAEPLTKMKNLGGLY